MTLPHRPALVSIVFIATIAASCGDTPGDSGDDDDDAVAADATPSSTPDAALSSTADAAPHADAAPTPDGPLPACLNDADQSIPIEEIDAAANTCGNRCILDSTPNCVRDCMIEEIGVTEPCAACYDAMVACMVSNCALQCIDDTSEACETCRLANCAEPFTECSGLEG